MRIIYICTYTIPTEKALGIQITQMCSAFANVDGVDVELLVPSVVGKDADLYDYYSLPRNFTTTKIRTPDFSGFGRVGYWLRTIVFLIRARLYARRMLPDILYAREPAVGIFISGHVLEMHTLPRKITLLHRYLWSRAGKVVALTSFIKDSVVRNTGKTEGVEVFGDAVSEGFLRAVTDRDTARKKTGLPGDRNIVAYVGKYKTPFAEGKGVKELIEAFPDIKRRCEKSFLLLVGINDDSIVEVEDLCDKAGIAKNDREVVGHVKHYDVPFYLSSADVLVMNYPWSDHHAYQMSSMKLFEYMAAKRPIVASDMPSSREMLNYSNSLLIKPDSRNELIEAVVRMLSDTDFACSVASEARRNVESRTWNARAERVVDFVVDSFDNER